MGNSLQFTVNSSQLRKTLSRFILKRSSRTNSSLARVSLMALNMLLKSKGFNRLQLSIVEYQFPSRVRPQPEPNWLMVKGKIQTRTRKWDFVDPCLEDLDFPILASFFKEVAHRRALPGAQVRFCEPNLKFQLIQYRPDDAWLRVHLTHEARPTWFKNHTLYIDFWVTSKQLWHSAAELEEEIKIFKFLSDNHGAAEEASHRS